MQSQAIEENLTKIEHDLHFMAAKTFQKLLEETFPVPGKDAWEKIALKESDGEPPFQKLEWAAAGGKIKLRPIYDASVALPVTLQPDESAEIYGNRRWLNTPAVTVLDEVAANKRALDHLRNGADAILFRLTGSSVNFEKLLQDIEPRYCGLFFSQQTEDVGLRNSWNQFAKAHNLTGLEGAWIGHRMESFRYHLIPVAEDNSVNEVANALAMGVSAVELGVSIESIGFSLSLTNSFVETIAKLKALRSLWYQVARAYGHEQFNPMQLFLHTESRPWIKESFQPHGNMLSATTRAASAIAGGANALTIHQEDESNEMMNRIARNVSNVLREESGLHRVADPLAGSWAIDHLTNALCEEAWQIFQSRI